MHTCVTWVNALFSIGLYSAIAISIYCLCYRIMYLGLLVTVNWWRHGENGSSWTVIMFLSTHSVRGRCVRRLYVTKESHWQWYRTYCIILYCILLSERDLFLEYWEPVQYNGGNPLHIWRRGQDSCSINVTYRLLLHTHHAFEFKAISKLLSRHAGQHVWYVIEGSTRTERLVWNGGIVGLREPRVKVAARWCRDSRDKQSPLLGPLSPLILLLWCLVGGGSSSSSGVASVGTLAALEPSCYRITCQGRTKVVAVAAKTSVFRWDLFVIWLA